MAAIASLKALGFGQLRVRHHGVTARLECEPEVFDQVLARRGEVIAAVRGAGFTFVALDLEGFRSGSMNRLLPIEELLDRTRRNALDRDRRRNSHSFKEFAA